ncbi:nodulation protein NfeD [Gallaecimonas kandeliae]|uniref:NfeD family protein n=1 Tax=Gallaecimonas kandeliae TaxID=3029055 RepID=UPI002648254D|nr:nodulation protein NfeD [Gallaecimonas kandeliae]WKE66163.1 nodulation protein NfeD [Gallaecimonas kandeliae]
MKTLLFWILLLCSGAVLAQGTYWQLDIKGAIGPGTADYLAGEIERANQAPAPPVLLLIVMDTPGGLSSATHDINRAILGSAIPVVVYVSPPGARAASAGTFILYASHLAAMAPATHLGAASPIQIGGLSPGGEKKDEDQNQKTLAHKQMNDAVADIRALAQLRGRNADWGEAAVKDAATLTASEALDKKVIEVLAKDRRELLAKLDGRTVETHAGKLVLHTRDLVVVEKAPDWRQRFIMTITDPNVAYILMLLGIYGLLLEFYSPGFGVSGTVGVICLLLAMLAFQMLPISYAGLGLVLVGLGLLLAEAMIPSFGVLGIGGLVAFCVGSVLLFETPDQAFRVAWPLIAAFATSSLLLLLVVVRMLLGLRHRAAVSGLNALIGMEAEVVGAGRVRLQGELWNAACSEPLKSGQKVRVEAVDGLLLHVSANQKETKP